MTGDERARRERYADRLRTIAADIRANPQRQGFGFDDRFAEHLERHADRLEHHTDDE